MSVDLGPFVLTGSAPPADGIAEAFSPRRTVLDKVLVDAAVEAGVELREAFTVREVVAHDGRVSGVRGSDKGGSAVTETARVVVELCSPTLDERVHSGTREERWRGGAIDNFFNRSHGPGWALVGDAGYTKDPCTAQGITDAFRDAELVVDAIDAGLSGRRPLEAALDDYERRRNEIAMPFYEFTCQLAPFDTPPPDMLQLYDALRGNQAQIDRFLGLFAETASVPEFFAPDNIQRIIAAASRA